jgi:hypothetical protein
LAESGGFSRLSDNQLSARSIRNGRMDATDLHPVGGYPLGLIIGLTK